MKSIQYEENLDGRTADTRWRYISPKGDNKYMSPKGHRRQAQKKHKKILVDTEPIIITTT